MEKTLKGKVVKLKSGNGPLMVVASDEDEDGLVEVTWGTMEDVRGERVPACCLEPSGILLDGLSTGSLSIKAAELLGGWRAAGLKLDKGDMSQLLDGWREALAPMPESASKRFGMLTVELLEALAR